MAKAEAPTIETVRLILRRRMAQDIPYMTEMFNEENVRKYLGGYPPCDKYSMLRMVRERKPTDWHIILKDSGEFVGECGLSKIVDGFLGEVSYLIKEEYWGKGYTFEAMKAIISYSFAELKLSRLYATINKDNVRSRKLIEKLGFSLHAVIPQADLSGIVADVAYYSLTK